MEWWVFPALVLCAVTFLAAAGVLVFLAARGVWRLLARYEPAHAAGPVGERWVPWDTDPRFGSMQLDADVGWSGTASPAQEGPSPVPATLPPRDWREVAHEGDWPVYDPKWPEGEQADWRAQTAADLAPATLDSGPGGLAWPGLDAHAAGQAWEGDGAADSVSSEVMVRAIPEPEPVRTVAGRLVETSDEWLRRLVANAAPGWTYAGTVAA